MDCPECGGCGTTDEVDTKTGELFPEVCPCCGGSGEIEG